MIIQNIKKSIEISKKGIPFARVLIQLDEHQDGKGNLKWISGFGNKITWAWKTGDDINPEITENGDYLNFSFGNTEENRLDVYMLPATIGFVMSLIKNKPENQVKQDTPTQDKSASVEEEEIPF